MCGIVGYFSPEGQCLPDAPLDAAVERIRHRGPDDCRISGGNGWRIAFARLAIHDLSELGMQPFSDGPVTAFVNGEIYNYRELLLEHPEFVAQSGSDCEIVPHLYRRYGIDFLNRINGMFGMVLLDERRRICQLVSDRNGVRPLYYALRDGVLFFASELKALGELVPLEVDPAQVRLTMAMATSFPPATPFRNVNRVPAGCLATMYGREFELKTWYQPRVKVNHKWSFEALQSAFLERFDDSVRLRLLADVPVGGYISGGLDSTSIVATVKHLSDVQFNLFNAVISNRTGAECYVDNENARKLAGDLDLPYHAVSIDADFYNQKFPGFADQYDEIMSDSGSFIFFAIAERAKPYVSVLLDGIGGDELFGGYPWQHHEQFQRRGFHRVWQRSWLRIPYSAGFHWFLDQNFKLQSQRYLYAANPELVHLRSFGILGESIDQREYAESFSALAADWKRLFDECLTACDGDYYNALQFSNRSTILCHQTSESDRGAMSASIEGRNPFLDYKVNELMMSVPSCLKLAHGPKSLMRKIFSERLPDYILKSPKSGPTLGVEEWFKNQALHKNTNRFFKRHRDDLAFLIGANTTDALLARFDGHSYGIKRSAILALLIWSRRYLRNEPIASGITIDSLVGGA